MIVTGSLQFWTGEFGAADFFCHIVAPVNALVGSVPPGVPIHSPDLPADGSL